MPHEINGEDKKQIIFSIANQNLNKKLLHTINYNLFI